MEEDTKNNEKRLEFLKETIEISDKVDYVTENIINLLNTTNISTLNPIKPLIFPRRNINKLIGLYELFWDSQNKLRTEREKIEKFNIFKEEAIELKELDNMHILPILKDILNSLDTIKDHMNIIIFKKLYETENSFFNTVVDAITKTVISSLKRLPKVADKLEEYSHFVVKHSEGNNYIKEYSTICQQRLGFVGLAVNTSTILQQTTNLTKRFNMIKELNIRILGAKPARTVNEGLVKMMVINLKIILSNLLLKIEKDESLSDILFLGQLYCNLNHSEGEEVEEIEFLFEIKPQILRIIFNCFIQFFGKLSILETPRADCKAEKIAVELSDILHLFNKEKALLKDWVTKFGSSFGVYKEPQMSENFSEKCLLRIFEIADELEVHRKAVYLINNIYLFKDFLKKIQGLEIDQQLYKYCQTILGIVKIENANKIPTKVYNSLVATMKETKTLALPDKERAYIQKGLKKQIDEMMLREAIDGSLKVLFEALEECYSGSQQ